MFRLIAFKPHIHKIIRNQFLRIIQAGLKSATILKYLINNVVSKFINCDKSYIPVLISINENTDKDL
jgi:hypothetical protein